MSWFSSSTWSLIRRGCKWVQGVTLPAVLHSLTFWHDFNKRLEDVTFSIEALAEELRFFLKFGAQVSGVLENSPFVLAFWLVMPALFFATVNGAIHAYYLKNGTVLNGLDANSLQDHDVTNNEDKLRDALNDMTIQEIDITLHRLNLRIPLGGRKARLVDAFIRNFDRIKARVVEVHVNNAIETVMNAPPSHEAQPPTATVQTGFFKGEAHRLGNDEDEQGEDDQDKSNEICIRIAFEDKREGDKPVFGHFHVMIDENLSPISLGVKVVEEYNKDTAHVLKEFLDLSNFDFKQVLVHNGFALVAGNGMKSLKSLGIKNFDIIAMMLFNPEDDHRFVQIWEDAMKGNFKVGKENINLVLLNATVEKKTGTFTIIAPQELKLRFTVFYDVESQAKEVFSLLEAQGFEMEKWRVQWQNIEGKSFLHGHEKLSTYVGHDTIMHLVPVMLGGAKFTVMKNMKKKTVITKELDFNAIFVLAKKVSAWTNVEYDGFMKSVSKDDLETMMTIFKKGRAHLDVRIKNMAEVADEVKKFTEAIGVLTSAKDHLCNLIYEAFATKFADENGEVDTETIKKSIDFFIRLKEHEGTVKDDVKMDDL